MSFVTGDCTAAAVGCPDGFALECVEQSDFPLGPPKINECLQQPYNPFPRQMRHTTGGLVRFDSYYAGLMNDDGTDTYKWYLSYTSNGMWKINGICYIPETNEFLLSGLGYTLRQMVVLRVNADTGAFIYRYEQDLTDWVTYNIARCGTSVVYNNGAIYVSGLFYAAPAGTKLIAGYIQFNYTTGVHTKTYGANTDANAHDIYGDEGVWVEIAGRPGTDILYISYSEWRTNTGQAVHYEGTLYTHDVNTISSTLLATNPDRFANKMEVIGDKLICTYNHNWSAGDSALGGYNYQNSSKFEIYDVATGIHVKTLTSPYPNDAVNTNDAGNCFGHRISYYGNYIVIGSYGELTDPAALGTSNATGASYLLDSDWNILQRLSIAPREVIGTRWGWFVYMLSDTIMHGNYGSDISQPNAIMICGYTNYGIA